MPDPSSVNDQVASLWGGSEEPPAQSVYKMDRDLQDVCESYIAPCCQHGQPHPVGPPPLPAALPGFLAGRKLELRIPGTPQPGGSKRAFIPKGWTRPVLTDDNPKAADWKRTVQVFSSNLGMTHLLDGPIRATCTFLLRRRATDFGKYGLKPNAPTYHTVRPDATKLWRSTEDALKGIVWTDDARVAIQHVEKVYSNNGWTGALIEIEEIAVSQPGHPGSKEVAP